MYDPGPVGRAHARRHQVGEVGEAGQQTADQGPLVVPGARMDHQPRRLVDHGQRVVGVDDLEAHAGLRRHAGSLAAGSLIVRVAPRGAPHAPPRRASRRPGPGPQRSAASPRPGDVGHHGHATIDPDARQERRDLRRNGLFRHWLRRHGIPAHAASSTLGRAGDRSPNNNVAMMTITPTVTQASATLNVGQSSQRDEVGHPSPGPAHDPLAQVPDGTPEHEARSDRQGHGADLRHDEGQHHDTDAQQHRHQKRPPAEEAEGEPRVVGERQAEGAPDVAHVMEVVQQRATW